MVIKLAIYQVDAFASERFRGNPAAVCMLEQWLEKRLMQEVAAENNLSETAFIVPAGRKYEIRWFTPLKEVDLCGHATLASAHVLYEHLAYEGDRIEFVSMSRGSLFVERTGDLYTLDFPSDTFTEIGIPEKVSEALRKTPIKAYKGRSDYMFVYGSQSDIENLNPDFSKLRKAGSRGVIVTALGLETDIVSRFFAPAVGIDEDPVTGSAHTTLIPYWSRVLGRKKLTARQLSSRGGELVCEYLGERVKISGQAVTYMIGEIHI